MRFKLSLSLLTAALVIFLTARYFTATEPPALPNEQDAALTVEPLPQTELKAVPFATHPLL